MEIAAELTKIKQVDKKYYMFLCGSGVLIAVLLGLIIFFFIKGLTVNKDLHDTLKKINRFEDRLKMANAPSEERLQFLTEQLNGLKDIYEKLPFDYLEDKTEESSFSSQDILTFKEAIFDTKNTLKKKAKSKNISFPNRYGLEVYESQMPSPEELKKLKFLKSIMESLINLLVNHNVDRISFIKFTEVFEKNFSSKDPEKYKEYFIDLSFQSDFIALSKVLNQLAMSEHLYYISNIKIEEPSDETNELGEVIKAKEGSKDITIRMAIFKIIRGGS